MEKMKGRIHAIDGIRGFSLFGILSANLLIFQYGLWGTMEISLFELSSYDKWMHSFIQIVIEGSFMPIFTFLFGYSMIIMTNNFENRGLGVKRHLFRRSIFLIVLGILHGIYIWEGDILLPYGILMLLLLPFARRSAKAILLWAIVLWTIFVVLIGIGGSLEENITGFEDSESLYAYVEKTKIIYGTGTYQEIMDFRNNEEVDILNGVDILMAMLFLPFMMLPMFLMGMYAGKKKWFMNIDGCSQRLGLLAGTLIFIGIAGKSLHILTQLLWLSDLVFFIGTYSLSFGYICLIAYIYHQVALRKNMKYFEAVGKMSLTNYILQSVICTIIFYGYGFGWFGKLGVTTAFLIGIGIFIGQMILSYLYFKVFNTGPLEHLARMWTYFSFRGKNKRDKNCQASKA